MNVFTPRHLRKGAKNSSGGSMDIAKQRAFRRCARISKQFIRQSASVLESPEYAARYAAYCAVTAQGQGFRKGS